MKLKATFLTMAAAFGLAFGLTSPSHAKYSICENPQLNACMSDCQALGQSYQTCRNRCCYGV